MNNSDIQKQLAKLRRNKKLLWIGIMVFVMVVLWILTSIFATSKTSSVSPELRDLAKSFVPRLESAAFEGIIGKRIYSADELSYFPIYILDKKNTDINPVLIDIIAPLEDLVGTESGQLEQISPLVSPSSSQPTQTDQTNQSPQATGSANKNVDFIPIPLESIVGPQN
jgi:hypothetical protein